MLSFEGEIEFDVICTCGSDLKAQTSAKGGNLVEVEPCMDCINMPGTSFISALKRLHKSYQTETRTSVINEKQKDLFKG